MTQERVRRRSAGVGRRKRTRSAARNDTRDAALMAPGSLLSRRVMGVKDPCTSSLTGALNVWPTTVRSGSASPTCCPKPRRPARSATTLEMLAAQGQIALRREHERCRLRARQGWVVSGAESQLDARVASRRLRRVVGRGSRRPGRRRSWPGRGQRRIIEFADGRETRRGRPGASAGSDRMNTHE